MDYFTFRGCEGNLVQARIFCFTLSCTGNFFVSISVYAFLSVTCFFWLNVREFFSAVVVCISCVCYKYFAVYSPTSGYDFVSSTTFTFTYPFRASSHMGPSLRPGFQNTKSFQVRSLYLEPFVSNHLL